MDKLEILEEIIGAKIPILKSNFKITMDSRMADNNTVFFAINKGNDFVDEALKKGAYVIFDKGYEKENSFLVDDTIKFMQKFASRYREKKDFKVIGITGSNGKTSVKDILYSVLSKKAKTHRTSGNHNNHIGLPYTILTANDDDEYLILEMGMSELKEIELLAKISKPNVSVITNIGQSHLEFLKTMDNVFKAKTELIPYTKEKVFVNARDEYLKTLLGKDKVELVETKVFETNLLGSHNQTNISLVNAVLEYFGYVNNDFTQVDITSGRFEIIEKEKIRYINDAYNASPISMKASINTFNSLYNEDYKVIAIADMLELGQDSIKYHQEIEKYLSDCRFNEILLYGKYMRYLYENIKDLYKAKYFEDKKEMKDYISKINTNKKITVLLKGSRSMRMEEIMEDK